jgi:hypothetical protein
VPTSYTKLIQILSEQQDFFYYLGICLVGSGDVTADALAIFYPARHAGEQQVITIRTSEIVDWKLLKRCKASLGGLRSYIQCDVVLTSREQPYTEVNQSTSIWKCSISRAMYI